MTKYEKSSLLKFTLIYFLSIAVFIIVLGYLYYQQQKTQLLQKYTMNMHQYKMNLYQSMFKYKLDGYSFEINSKERFKYQLATKEGDFYLKSFPVTRGTNHILIKVRAEVIDNELFKIKRFTIVLQIILILFFLFVSFVLAKISLKPMNDTISHLDRFIKDLIHDLNTPSTAILLNSKMLKKELKEEKSIKKIKRIESSANSIASLYENLEILINKNFKKQKINLTPLIKEKIENCNIQYPNIDIQISDKDMIVDTNEKAISRIIDNILSNACKYCSQNPKITISFKNKILTIEDNGKGIKYPKKIFERSYTEDESGHGIGMHIVHRLCDDLDIKIDISSQKNKGTVVKLFF